MLDTCVDWEAILPFLKGLNHNAALTFSSCQGVDMLPGRPGRWAWNQPVSAPPGLSRNSLGSTGQRTIRTPFPNDNTQTRCRWASGPRWTPEYRFAGRVWVFDIAARPQSWNGLVFHPVHISNCDNYWIRIWERDQPGLTFAREVNDDETTIARVPFPIPALSTWHDYRIDVLSGSRIRFHWNGSLILDTIDPTASFSGGPVGMRLDYFDAILADTRVYQP